MPRIGAVSAKPVVSNPHKPEKMIIEVDSPLGRDAFELDFNKQSTQESLRFFLSGHGFKSADPQRVIERAKDASEMDLDNDLSRCRLERLGFERDRPLALPSIGQAHELEFADLRSKLPGQAQIGHAVSFVKSSQKLNGVTEMQIVSETLGERTKDATTEIILGPASTKEEYFDLMAKVARIRARVQSTPEGTKLSMAEAYSAAYENTKSNEKSPQARGEIWQDAEEDLEGPCVHTSRGLPIRFISTVLQEPQSRLGKEAKQLLKLASNESDSLVRDWGLKTSRGHKLWETINLSIWMAACEGVLDPLMPGGEPLENGNDTIKDWTLYAGKNFFGVVSRFCAGDLLRSGGLQERDMKQIRALFVGPDSEQNTKNFERLVLAAENTAHNFVTHLESSRLKDHLEIAQILRKNWLSTTQGSVMRMIRSDLKIDFLPREGSSRYPEDTNQAYGRNINVDTRSPSFAHSQFVPRRERLSIDPHSKAPVSGAFEFRAGEYVGNSRVDAHFTPNRKRPRQDLEASWVHFEKYVDRLRKRAKTRA